jgi:tRNA 2-thiocytidine biosynthesis protein TtcA
LAALAARRRVPLIPCNLCGSQPQAQRRQMKMMLENLERDHPNLRQTMLAALGNVHLSHLLVK